jgi:hypothetical protein
MSNPRDKAVLSAIFNPLGTDLGETDDVINENLEHGLFVYLVHFVFFVGSRRTCYWIYNCLKKYIYHL